MVRGLIAACHPGPTLVVTAAITGLALSLGRGPVGGLAVLLAVLSGQLSVGWANDAHDADRDRRAQRWDKPVVRGWVSERTLWVAAGTAATACIPLSFLAGGPIGGTAHIIAVASAWAYDLWLKTTPWSFVPYMVSFGLVAPFLTYGLTPPQPPAGWAVATLSLLGLGAHLANGIPDIDTDRATDSHGLVGRLGARLSANLAVVALLAATALLVGHLDLPRTTAIVILAGLAALSVLAASTAGGRHLFKVVMLLALTDALLLSLKPDHHFGRLNRWPAVAPMRLWVEDVPSDPARPDRPGPRLHVMTGKGGTGKTTLAAAAALAAAGGRRALNADASLRAGERGETCLTPPDRLPRGRHG